MVTAMNSCVLFDTLWCFGRGSLHDFPDVTENPLMPMGHASVNMMLVGTRIVSGLKLTPW
jgi:hypothetical protein